MPASSNMKRTGRRPSYINLQSANSSTTSLIATDVLSPRTPRNISKSRRSSIVAEHATEAISNESKRSSIASGPPLLSDSTNSYFQDMASGDDVHIRSETPTLRARNSIDDLNKRNSGNASSSSRRTRSSSISSLLGSTHVLPSFDVHTLYKIKTTRSSKKLDHFFGEFAPHDICIKEIRKEGLKAILESKSPLCYFLFHLLQEYSSENLFFFIELEQYESFTYASLGQQLATAQHIFNTYLTRNSYFEVNLDDKVRRSVTESLDKKDAKSCFDGAKRAVYSLLESSFVRFQNTETFQDMVDECGELTTHYDDKSRRAAVNRLLIYIEEQHTKIYNTESNNSMYQSVSQTTKRRHELIKSMIHEFCRTLVGVEFNYYTPADEEESQSPSPRQNFRHVGFPSFSNAASANSE
ncbi:hypothetical protein INT47_005334 [Mucor saturninus]|uniref:RGS domain-containing protein n=1 Tax=Mucor saturninus TaxID=64648 RepID=A0A8H7V0X0_9FUNG|nr:hypothetical protein INT47_005334 [Mucor saturninus]